MTNSIDDIVEYIIQTGPSFISPESMKNITCVCQKINKIDQKKVPVGSPQKC